MSQPLIFAAIKRHVFAFDAATGEQVWKIKLPGFWGSFSTLLVDQGVLYVARHGRLHAIDPERGDILWTVEDRDLKHAPVMLATSSGASSGQQQGQHHHRAMQTGAAAGGVVAASLASS